MTIYFEFWSPKKSRLLEHTVWIWFVQNLTKEGKADSMSQQPVSSIQAAPPHSPATGPKQSTKNIENIPNGGPEFTPIRPGNAIPNSQLAIRETKINKCKRVVTIKRGSVLIKNWISDHYIWIKPKPRPYRNPFFVLKKTLPIVSVAYSHSVRSFLVLL